MSINVLSAFVSANAVIRCQRDLSEAFCFYFMAEEQKRPQTRQEPASGRPQPRGLHCELGPGVSRASRPGWGLCGEHGAPPAGVWSWLLPGTLPQAAPGQRLPLMELALQILCLPSSTWPLPGSARHMLGTMSGLLKGHLPHLQLPLYVVQLLRRVLLI